MRFGDVVRYSALWITHQLTNPAHIQYVLQTNFSNYRKGRDYRILRLSLGEGLLTSEGALWQRQRKMTQPALHSQQVASFIRIMQNSAQALMEKWERPASQGRAVDIVPDLMHLTLNIASHALFTTNLESETEIIREALTIGRDYSVDQAWSIVRLPPSFPTRKNRRYLTALARFHSVIDRMIVTRRSVAQKPPDLLTMLMEARDEDGRTMSDKQLRDEVATLLTAGHETTTLALSWACYLLATHPEIQQRARSELEFLGGRAPGYEDFQRMRYSRMVIDETLRLYPPVWVISRQAVADDEIGGYKIPAGSEILVFPYITHRHPRWWPDPEKFIPERFRPENASSRQKFAYIPFGAGPRACLGLNFAMTEIQIVLALILQRFHLELAAESAQVSPDPSVTLRPIPGIHLKLTPLERASNSEIPVPEPSRA